MNVDMFFIRYQAKLNLFRYFEKHFWPAITLPYYKSQMADHSIITLFGIIILRCYNPI